MKRLLILTALVAGSAVCASAADGRSPEWQDLSLLVAPDRPSTWPAVGWPLFQINPYLRIGPRSAYNSEILTIDLNTGTQLDVPPHSVPPPDSGLPNAGPLGLMYSDKAPAWQFGGEACVIDVRELRDGPNGRSSLIQKEHIQAWEQKHRPLRFGDVVLFYSGYSDKYYLPLPAGRRFVSDPVEGKAPGWPDPAPETMEYLATRNVMTLGTDSPSMGPIPDMAEPTHLAGLKHGMIWTEGATNLGSLPATGAFYCMLAPKHRGGVANEARAFAIVGQPLAQQLSDSARAKRVVDLSVTMADDLPVWWPGAGAGRHRQPYITINFMKNPVNGAYQQTHTMDSHTGTHLVPPSYALPAAGFDNQRYPAEVQPWLAAFEKQFGPRGASDVTAEKVPLSQTSGWARVIPVEHRAGTTSPKDWPRSPEITVEDVQKYETEHGALKPGEIVIFRSGYSDRYFKPFPEGNACLLDPLNGKSEGWPAPGPKAIRYLAGKGIRCVATDGPTLGGSDPQQALMTYWMLGTKGMVAVEYLTNLDKLPARAYFVFAALKIRNSHGGPGRALAFY